MFIIVTDNISQNLEQRRGQVVWKTYYSHIIEAIEEAQYSVNRVPSSAIDTYLKSHREVTRITDSDAAMQTVKSHTLLAPKYFG